MKEKTENSSGFNVRKYDEDAHTYIQVHIHTFTHTHTQCTLNFTTKSRKAHKVI